MWLVSGRENKERVNSVNEEAAVKTSAYYGKAAHQYIPEQPVLLCQCDVIVFAMLMSPTLSPLKLRHLLVLVLVLVLELVLELVLVRKPWLPQLLMSHC